MDLDPVSLRLFIHIAESGRLVEGARRLNVVPSAASKRIMHLEGLLKAQLLRRTNHGVELTAAGQALETLARRVLTELDNIAPQIRDYSEGIRGRVRVLASASAICQFLPSELASFLSEHPQIDVHFEERNTGGVLKEVAENIADLGITFTTQHSHQLQDMPYHKYGLSVLVPKSHELASLRTIRLGQSLGYPHIGLWANSAANLYLSRRAAEINRVITWRMFVDSYHSISLMVRSGLGIGIVPEGAVEFLSPRFGIKAIKLDEPWGSRELHIYFLSRNKLQAASRLLLDHLQQCAAIRAGK